MALDAKYDKERNVQHELSDLWICSDIHNAQSQLMRTKLTLAGRCLQIML